MEADCHIHMVLDGENWREAIARHRDAPDMAVIHAVLARYQALGCQYLRDGGDKWGVGAAARAAASSYGIVYRTPLAPLHKQGCYGGFLGESWQELSDFRQKVEARRKAGADFIKIMISGLMDFDQFGVLTHPGIGQIEEQIHIAHGEGFSVMAHANGDEAVLAAAKAGVDSVEHGAYLTERALCAMGEKSVVWVPTLSTIGNLRGTGRFSQVERILQSALENVAAFGRMGGLIAPGTDAGAWAVPHGAQTEVPLLRLALGSDTQRILERGICAIRERF